VVSLYPTTNRDSGSPLGRSAGKSIRTIDVSLCAKRRCDAVLSLGADETG
jgi:hypothetical protein